MIDVRLRCWKAVNSSIMNCNRSFHEALFGITRNMRESESGEIACCGSFLPKFVSQLNDSELAVSDNFKKISE
jgi:hypothetical protein